MHLALFANINWDNLYGFIGCIPRWVSVFGLPVQCGQFVALTCSPVRSCTLQAVLPWVCIIGGGLCVLTKILYIHVHSCK